MINFFLLFMKKINAFFIKKIDCFCLQHYFQKKNIKCNVNDITFWGDVPHFTVEDGGTMIIGEDLVISSGKENGIDGFQSRIKVASGAILCIGRHVGLSNISLICRRQITIGDYVNIGAGCLIMDSNFHSLNWEERLDRVADQKKCLSKPIFIEDSAFIGARSIVCKGVSIGARSIIAAGSVVICDVPSDEIWGGNPARFIKKIF